MELFLVDFSCNCYILLCIDFRALLQKYRFYWQQQSSGGWSTGRWCTDWIFPPFCFTLSTLDTCQHHREKVLQKDFVNTTLLKACQMICMSKFLRKCSYGRVSAGTEESRKCGGDLVVAHVTGRKVGGQLETERGERERVAVEWPGPGLPSQWTPQPRRRLQSIAMGRALLSSGQASLFVYHKKAVYVITHNTQPGSWARRNQGEILWKKKISNSISRTRCKQVFLSNLYFMKGL